VRERYFHRLGDKNLGPLFKAGCNIEFAIRAAASAFEQNSLYYGHGTDTAIDEASWLISHGLGISPLVAPDYDRTLSSAECDNCHRLIMRRIQERIPVAYITGETWFADHRFLVDERALIPRSPLAEFINGGFFGLLESFPAPRILDMCTGGGCIAIATALALPDSQVDASDLSSDALSLAQDNVRLHQLEDRIQLLEGSLFEPITQTYSLIISNPPYVDARDIRDMPDEFGHEPMMGLEAGDDGLELVGIMLKEAAEYLVPGGYLVVEVGNSGAALEDAYPHLPFGWLQFSQGGHGVFVLSREELQGSSS